MRLLGTALVAVMFVVLSQADAQDKPTAVMIPPHVEAGVSEQVVERVQEELRKQLEAAREHYTVLSPGQAVALAEHDHESRWEKPKGEAAADRCVSTDCAVWFRNLVNADVAVQLSIHNRLEGKKLRPGTLTVVLVEDAEARFSGSASLADGKIEVAVQNAFEEALTKRTRGIGPWLSVYGEPEGAQVFLDDEPIGKVPVVHYRIADASSMHVLSVRQHGYVEFSAALELKGDISRDERVEVNLAKEGSEAVARSSAEEMRRDDDGPRWHLLGGSMLMVAGAGVIGGTLIRQGMADCTRQAPGGRCTQEEKVQPAGLATWLSVGAVSIAGGLTWLLLGQRKRRATDAQRVHVDVGPRTIVVKGRF